MTQKEVVREWEALLNEIATYKTPFGEAIETLVADYGLDLEGSAASRPSVQGISTSQVIRDVREGRWRSYI